ncbi:C2 calcium-dependent domain-containing protein 4A-like [Psammomys obesus]|uniref:C2 calcium-dependent domain-containing protein 4A-like n=1 Tax=Psammomys obesus TaxID=48139 RepID=UPI002452DB50|nr:C2 calcium-dependent domain-containing protein 4A-like [Psammomys obesus]XP_055454797.1 C2 calcium-dependent domain-containing protein 4A-like [Psammomys obesus]
MWCLERLLRDRDGFLPGRARRAKARSSAACANVLTPDRIPEFCIPPRLEPSTAWAALRDAWAANADTHDGAGHTDWDPRSQAALSLPHLPRARTAYGFCALLECPHTRRKESLFLGHPGAPVPRLGLRQRAHTLASSRRVPDAPSPAPDDPDTARVLTPHAASRRRRLLRGPDGLLSRALRAPRGRAGARPGSRGDEHERAASCAPPAPSGRDPERLQAEASVAVGRGACTLRLAAEYCRRSASLRLRLLRAEGPAVALEPRAVGCRLSLVQRPSGQQRASVVRRSRKAALDQDCCFDGLSEEQLRRLVVRIKAESKGRGLERRRPLGQGELLLGSLLLL